MPHIDQFRRLANIPSKDVKDIAGNLIKYELENQADVLKNTALPGAIGSTASATGNTADQKQSK